MTPARAACIARCGVLLLLGALGLAGCQRESPMVSEYDKSMIVRAGDLEPFGWAYGDPAPHERFTKHVSWDGSYRLDYEFETPGTEVDHPLYLAVFVSVERLASDALLTQRAERIGLDIGLRGNDMTAREIQGFYPGAPFEVLEADGEPMGNVFSVRKGRKVYTLLLSGFYFDDPEAWKSLVDDKLRRFASDGPAAAATPAPAARGAPTPTPFVEVLAPGEDRTLRLRLSAPAAHALALDNCNGAFQWGLERQAADAWTRAWAAETDACLSAPIVIAAGTSRDFTVAISGPASAAIGADAYRAVVVGLHAAPANPPPVEVPTNQRTSAPFHFPADAATSVEPD